MWVFPAQHAAHKKCGGTGGYGGDAQDCDPHDVHGETPS